MSKKEIANKILNDESFLLEEVKKIQYCYGLKYEIRYGLERSEEDYTESVAEHIYGMHLITDYFLALEDEEGAWDSNTIRNTITWHDICELETGDVISWKKTPEDIKKEEIAWEYAVDKVPHIIKNDVYKLVEAYENLSTPEARFVKAIDKIEPLFLMYTPLGKKCAHATGQTRYHSERIKTPYISDFPFIKRFSDVLHDRMEAEGFFV